MVVNVIVVILILHWIQMMIQIVILLVKDMVRKSVVEVDITPSMSMQMLIVKTFN